MASTPTNSISGMAGDVRTLESLKARANADPKGAVREAAKQFESLFMNELMKSMRSTVMKAEADGAGASMSNDMFDQQMAAKMSGLPGGLSEAIMKQLERQMGLTPGPIPATGSANNSSEPLAAQPQQTRIPQTGAAGFVQQHSSSARKAEAETGIPASFMVSQAALETGWGRKEIRHADGSPSYNLFGIKAGANWKGPTADVTTTEYVNGKAQKVVARFRAYGSYAESFADYAKLMKDSPRYAQISTKANAKTGDAGAQFAMGLQKAGYATDPAYADKLTKVINTTLRLQRSMVA